MAYTDLIPVEHSSRPNFMAMVGMTLQPAADSVAILSSFPQLFDLDIAVGQQLDVLGQWIGIPRTLTAPLTGVYALFDAIGLGFDEGAWQGPYDPASGIVSLDDTSYRMLLKMEVLNNHWDGTKATAYSIAQSVLGPLGYTFVMEDFGNLSIAMGILKAEPSPALLGTTFIIGTSTIGIGTNGAAPLPLLVQALLQQKKLDVKPIGIHVDFRYWQSADAPVAAFDLNSSLFAGFDLATWAAVSIN